MKQVLFLFLLLTFLSEGVAQNNKFNPAKNTSRKYTDNHGKMMSGSSSNCSTCPEVFITNGGFEQVPFTFPGVEFFDESLITDWNTTASNNLIEIWRTGFNGVPAIEGEFFAELNATEAATLYLEVCTDPFSTINWSIWHRGRFGVDVAEVRIGASLASLVTQSTLTTGLSWANYTGVYTVPAGQTSTIIAFTAVSTATGNNSAGNFIDDFQMILSNPPEFIVSCEEFAPPSAPLSSDGIINFIISQGPVGPYTITYDNGAGISGTQTGNIGDNFITNLPAGTYTITVTNINGCNATCEITLIGQECLLDLSTLLTPPTCNGVKDGSVTIVVNNGDGNYTYDWSENLFDGMNTATGLDGGQTISVTVTDGQMCSAETTVTINETLAINIACSVIVEPTTPLASDGIINFFITQGPVGPYTIVYDNGTGISGTLAGNIGDNFITNLPAGTYTVVITNINGCSATCDITLIGQECLLDLSTVITPPTCNGDNDAEVIIAVNNGDENYTYDWSENQFDGSPSATGLTGGQTISVTVTDGQMCSAETTVTINETLPIGITCAVNANPSSPLGSNGSINVNITSGQNPPLNISYNNNAGTSGTQAANAGSNMINNLPTGTYNLIVSNSKGCRDSCEVTLTAQACTFILSTNVSPPSCSGFNNASVNITPSNGNGPYSFDWSINAFDGLNTATGLSGGQTISVIVTDSLGCKAIDTVTIVAIPSIEIACSINAQPSGPQASDGSINLNIIAAPNPPINITYTNNAGTSGVLVANSGVNDINNLPTGTYTFTATNVNGCSTSCIVTLLADTCTFSLDISTTNETCAGSKDGYAIVTPLGGTPSYTYLWSNQSTFNEATNLSAGIYTVTVIDMNGCSGSSTFNINSTSAIISNFTTSICSDDSIYVNGVVFHKDKKTGQVTFTAASVNGCDSIVNVSINVYPESISKIDLNLCANETVSIADKIFNIDNPKGTVILPSASIDGCDSTVFVDLLFYPVSIGKLDTILCSDRSLTVGNQIFDKNSTDGTVILVGAGSNGCDSTVVVNTLYHPPLFAIMGHDTSVCKSQSQIVTLTLAPGNTYDFTIDFSNGEQLKEKGINSEIYFIPVNIDSQDISILLSSITASSGCSVNVIDDKTIIQFGKTQINLIANGDGDLVLDCTNSNNGTIEVQTLNSIGPFVFTWSNGATVQKIENLEPGTYQVSVLDGNGCKATQAITLSSPKPISVEAQGESKGCYDNYEGTITIDTIHGGVEPYEFSFNGTTFNDLSNNQLIKNGVVPGINKVYIRDKNGCEKIIAVDLPVIQELLMDLGYDQTISLGDSVLFNPELNFIPVSWTWNTQKGMSQLDTFITYVAPFETTNYLLTVKDANGCTVEDRVTIFVDDDVNVFIPNIFSPNNDGINDILTIYSGAGVLLIDQFHIFDRWGSLMFSRRFFNPNDLTQGWDGRFNGKDLNPGVFVYYAKIKLFNGETKVVSGDVTIVN
ncbi:MAG TPA: gliding motility-associated C-terminal domain-containing protein [Saprospiraceae bacterium]|nr:gliding motility-associated C-terminal domain-containing protein [Saprospiraceae bacterium]